MLRVRAEVVVFVKSKVTMMKAVEIATAKPVEK